MAAVVVASTGACSESGAATVMYRWPLRTSSENGEMNNIRIVMNPVLMRNFRMKKIQCPRTTRATPERASGDGEVRRRRQLQGCSCGANPAAPAASSQHV